MPDPSQFGVPPLHSLSGSIPVMMKSHVPFMPPMVNAPLHDMQEAMHIELQQ